MDRRTFLTVSLLGTTLAVTGCLDEKTGADVAFSFGPQIVLPTDETTDASAPLMKRIRSTATGFRVGQQGSLRQLYVFFDAQCGHCARLWETSKVLHNQAMLIWVPVAYLNSNSARQGAAILAAPNSQAAMDEHEKSLVARKGGLKVEAGDVPRKTTDAVKRNTDLLAPISTSVPFMVGAATDGQIVQLRGALPPKDITKSLGWPSPSA